MDKSDISQENVYLNGLEDRDNYIHMVWLKSKHSDESRKIVLIHGYGGGAAVFMRMAPLL